MSLCRIYGSLKPMQAATEDLRTLISLKWGLLPGVKLPPAEMNKLREAELRLLALRPDDLLQVSEAQLKSPLQPKKYYPPRMDHKPELSQPPVHRRGRL